ncbi:MAG: hypothetical protein K5765_06815 [Clostridia bacterium]|nr:hypothetical protein [Clostridia bacterium]
MDLNHDDLEKLASLVVDKIREEFALKHLSGNLVDTLRIENFDDKIEVIIPAEVYDMLLYQTKGVIVHTGEGSYASTLDENGSELYVYGEEGNGLVKITPRNHRDFVNKAIQGAINEWVALKGELRVSKIVNEKN